LAVSSQKKDEIEMMNAEEPVGIIISRGTRDEPAPAFWAYVWGMAPEAERPGRRRRAA
jgi:hypothetical protein